MNELALFAGAGGGILAGHLLGWRTVCAVEWEQYPASVLCARQNDGLLPPFPVWDDVQTFDGKPWRGIVDVVSGGFPCQDISAAGKGAGIDGERSGMWGEMARIIHEVRPKFVFVENSPMLTSRGLGRVLGDLAQMGFDARWGVLGAVDVGANHKRDRIWIVGTNMANSKKLYSNGGKDNSRISMERETQLKSGNSCRENNVANANSLKRRSLEIGRPSFNDSEECGDLRGILAFDSGNEQKETREILANTDLSGCRQSNETIQRKSSKQFDSNGIQLGKDVPNANDQGLQGRLQNRILDSQRWKEQGFGRITECGVRWQGDRDCDWSTEPNVGRVADGVAARVDRLKSIGNGQVPLCAATAWKLLSK